MSIGLGNLVLLQGLRVTNHISNPVFLTIIGISCLHVYSGIISYHHCVTEAVLYHTQKINYLIDTTKPCHLEHKAVVG